MTGEIPDRTCAVTGCSDAAVARLFDHGGDSGLRCVACLEYDLDARQQTRADGGTVPSVDSHHRQLRGIRGRARATARKLRGQGGNR